MTDQFDWRAMEEADKRGILPDNLKGALYEAQSRGLTGPTKGAQRAQGGDIPFTERLRQGVADIGQGAVQLTNHLFGGPLEANTPGGYDAIIAKQQGDYAARREEAGAGGGLPDFARLGGNMTAMLPAAAAIPSAEGIGAGLALGGAGGAAMGALTPVTDPNADFAKEKLGQSLMGGGVGAITGGVGGAMAKAIAPKVAPPVKSLMNKGVTPTVGQILGGTANKMEERLASYPFVGDMIASGRRRSIEDFNRAALADAVAPIGKTISGKVGREGIEEVEKTIGAEYDKLLPNLTFQADHQLVSDVANLRQMASFLPDKEFAQFEKVLQQKIGTKLGPNGTMDGETFKTVESELSRLAKDYKKDSSADANHLGDAIYELLGSMRESLERNNPMYAEPLANANTAWARFKRIQKAATSIGGEPGVFSADQFQTAVRAMDASKDKGAFARGNALMQGLSDDAKSVLGSKVPDSGTPQRMAAMLLTAGGGGWIEPSTLLASGALTLPYTKLGQKALAAALTKRPPGSDFVADLFRRGTLPASMGAAGAVLPNR